MKRQLTEEQKAKSAERKAKFRALWKTVAATPELERIQKFGKLGIITVEGHELSLANMMLVAMQKPGATVVGGFRQWIKQGRAVRKGEHGAMIWCPTEKKVEKGTMNPAGEAGSVEAMETHFIIGTVFDIGQTDEIEVGTAVVGPAIADAFGMRGLPNTIVDEEPELQLNTEAATV